MGRGENKKIMSVQPGTYNPMASVMLATRGQTSAIEGTYTVQDIERERDFARKKERIIEEFRKIDRNSDQHITLDEWMLFIQQQVHVSSIIESRPAN